MVVLALACTRPEPTPVEKAISPPSPGLPEVLATVGGWQVHRDSVKDLVVGGLQQSDLRLWVTAVELAVDASLTWEALNHPQRSRVLFLVHSEQEAHWRQGGDERWRAALAQRLQTADSWRLDRRTDLSLDQLVAAQAAQPPDEKKIAERYAKRAERYAEPERVHLAEIAIAADGPAQVQAAEAQLAAALGRLQAGEPFAQVAQAVSTVPSAAQGGERGWSAPGDLDPQLARALQALQPGQHSAVLRTTFGVHILQLVERQAARPRSAQEARPLIVAELQADRAFVLRRERLRAMRRAAPIAWAAELQAVAQTDPQRPAEPSLALTPTAAPGPGVVR